MAESMTNTRILDVLAQFTVGIDGALDAWTVDFLDQIRRVLEIRHN
jgi:transcriptional regulator with XRE-family HTH domain